MEFVIGVQFLGEAGIELFTALSRPALGIVPVSCPMG